MNNEMVLKKAEHKKDMKEQNEQYQPQKSLLYNQDQLLSNLVHMKESKITVKLEEQYQKAQNFIITSDQPKAMEEQLKKIKESKCIICESQECLFNHLLDGKNLYKCKQQNHTGIYMCSQMLESLNFQYQCPFCMHKPKDVGNTSRSQFYYQIDDFHRDILKENYLNEIDLYKQIMDFKTQFAKSPHTNSILSYKPRFDLESFSKCQMKILLIILQKLVKDLPQIRDSSVRSNNSDQGIEKSQNYQGKMLLQQQQQNNDNLANNNQETNFKSSSAIIIRSVLQLFYQRLQNQIGINSKYTENELQTLVSVFKKWIKNLFHIFLRQRVESENKVSSSIIDFYFLYQSCLKYLNLIIREINNQDIKEIPLQFYNFKNTIFLEIFVVISADMLMQNYENKNLEYELENCFKNKEYLNMHQIYKRSAVDLLKSVERVLLIDNNQKEEHPKHENSEQFFQLFPCILWILQQKFEIQQQIGDLVIKTIKNDQIINIMLQTLTFMQKNVFFDLLLPIDSNYFGGEFQLLKSILRNQFILIQDIKIISISYVKFFEKCQNQILIKVQNQIDHQESKHNNSMVYEQLENSNNSYTFMLQQQAEILNNFFSGFLSTMKEIFTLLQTKISDNVRFKNILINKLNEKYNEICLEIQVDTLPISYQTVNSNFQTWKIFYQYNFLEGKEINISQFKETLENKNILQQIYCQIYAQFMDQMKQFICMVNPTGPSKKLISDFCNFQIKEIIPTQQENRQTFANSYFDQQYGQLQKGKLEMEQQNPTSNNNKEDINRNTNNTNSLNDYNMAK